MKMHVVRALEWDFDLVKEAVTTIPSTCVEWKMHRKNGRISIRSRPVSDQCFLKVVDVLQNIHKHPQIAIASQGHPAGYVSLRIMLHEVPTLERLSVSAFPRYNPEKAIVTCLKESHLFTPACLLQFTQDSRMVRLRSLADRVRLQLEFYFGDKNLSSDSYLMKLLEEGGQRIPVALVLQFRRMQHMLSHLSIEEQMAVVAEALATCSVVKFDAKDQVLWKLSRLEMIQAQLEFWFSNENLEVDKYLRLQVESNEEGWVDANILLSFDRLVQASATVDDLMEVCKNSPILEFCSTEEGFLVRRQSDFVMVSGSQPSFDTISRSQKALQYVEFFMSDARFVSDPKLRRQVEQDTFVSIEELLKLPKVQKLLGEKEDPAQILVKAIQQSTSLVLSADGSNVGRKNHSIPEYRRIVFFGVDRNSDALHSVDPHVNQDFTLLCYNILADMYARPSWFNYAKPEHLDWSFRRRILKRELLYYKSDVVCLQEVQAPHDWESPESSMDCSNHLLFFVKFMTRAGYDFVYCRKIGAGGRVLSRGGPQLGNVIFWKKSVFEPLRKIEVPLADEMMNLAHQPKDRSALGRGYNQVALFMLLRHLATGRDILIGTTHITANWQEPHFQLLQVYGCTQAMESIREEVGTNVPTILAGDFNSTPETAAYEFLLTGQLPERIKPALRTLPIKRVRLSEMEPAGEENRPIFGHSMKLDSCYRAALGGSEVEFTNYTAEFKDTLDYIFYTVDSLVPVAVLKNYSEETLSQEVGLPSSRFPSDHVPLVARIAFLDP